MGKASNEGGRRRERTTTQRPPVMDANAAFDAIQKIARSSKNLADLESMKARAREVIDQFQVASPRASAEREGRVLRQYLEGACKTKRVDAIETPVFMEARDRLAGNV